jgi:hypothetical protein
MAKAASRSRRPNAHPDAYEEFMALSDQEKETEVQPAQQAKSRPLTPAQRKQWQRIQGRLKRNAGRPVIGAGAKQIAVTVERELLKRVDRFAKTHKMKRSQIIAQGMELVMKRAG